MLHKLSNLPNTILSYVEFSNGINNSYNMLDVAGVFGGSLFSAMCDSFITERPHCVV